MSALSKIMLPITGPLFIAVVLDAALLGLVTNQAYMYYIAFPKDHAAIKVTTAALYLIELVETILYIHAGFQWLARDLGGLGSIQDIELSWVYCIAMTGIVGCVVQTFFTYRIWVLSRSPVLCVLVLLVSFTGLGAALACVIQVTRLHAFTTGFPNIYNIQFWPAIILQVASAICDVVIAITMTIYLLKHKSDFKKTNMLVSRLISMTIETGTVTATIAMTAVVLFLVFPKSIYYSVPSAILSKLYVTTFMAILNNRVRISGGRNQHATANNALSVWTNFQAAERPTLEFNAQQDNYTSSMDEVAHDSLSGPGLGKAPTTTAVTLAAEYIA